MLLCVCYVSIDVLKLIASLSTCLTYLFNKKKNYFIKFNRLQEYFHRVLFVCAQELSLLPLYLSKQT